MIRTPSRMNESLQTIAERLGLTLRVTADGSEIVIRRDGAELWRTDRQREATAWINGYAHAARPPAPRP